MITYRNCIGYMIGELLNIDDLFQINPPDFLKEKEKLFTENSNGRIILYFKNSWLQHAAIKTLGGEIKSRFGDGDIIRHAIDDSGVIKKYNVTKIEVGEVLNLNFLQLFLEKYAYCGCGNGKQYKKCHGK